MATTLTIGVVDQSAKIQHQSMSCKLNTLDLTLVDPTTVPALGDAVTLTNPTWTGTVVKIGKSDPVDRATGHVYVRIAATNTVTATASAGPFGLSDAPNNSTTYGYRGLSVDTQKNTDGTTSTHGTCTIEQAGLWPAMTFPLTSGNFGYSGTSFSVVNVTVTWRTAGSPVFTIEFGDAIVTMAVWAASRAGAAPAGSIPGTAITAGSVDTPELHANAITAAKIAVGAVTADKLLIGDWSNVISNPGFETGDFSYWTTNPQGGAAASVQSTYRYGGKWAAYFTIGSAGMWFEAYPSNKVPVAVGEKILASVMAFGSSSPHLYIGVLFYDTSGNYISGDYADQGIVGASWRQVSYLATAPAGAAYALLYLYTAYTAAGQWIAIDDASMGRGGVAINPAGIAVQNGAITVKNAGATVIIDGTSDMFKIAATGTLTQAFPTGTYLTGSSLVSLTALGSAYTVPIPLLSTLTNGSAYGISRLPGVNLSVTATGTIGWYSTVESYLSASPGTPVVALVARTEAAVPPGSPSAVCRYFALVEAGI